MTSWLSRLARVEATDPEPSQELSMQKMKLRKDCLALDRRQDPVTRTPGTMRQKAAKAKLSNQINSLSFIYFQQMQAEVVSVRLDR